MAKKLLLVYPAPQLEWLKMSGLEMWAGPPLGLAYVAAATPDHWEIEIVDEYVDRIDLAADYDLVGISACTANATRGYQIGQIGRAHV